MKYTGQFTALDNGVVVSANGISPTFFPTVTDFFAEKLADSSAIEALGHPGSNLVFNFEVSDTVKQCPFSLQTADVLKEIESECQAQMVKWGIQNHPMLSPDLNGMTSKEVAEIYNVPTQKEARKLLEIAEKEGKLSYMHVLLEEFCEAVDCRQDSFEMRKELIQVAAVATSMIGAIDRQALNEEWERAQVSA